MAKLKKPNIFQIFEKQFFSNIITDIRFQRKEID